MEDKIKFPVGFLWGAATSAYQVEGGNRNNWSEWERKNAGRLAEEAKNSEIYQKEKFPEMINPQNYISGKACDHYNRFEEDFDIVKVLNHNAHRISLEWSRIEPEEGVFDEGAINHYRKVLTALKNRKIKTMVTLWHWTSPIWISDLGGEASKEFPSYFSRYAELVSRELGDLVDLWVTLNEPTTVIANGYIRGTFPPGKKSIFSAMRVFKNLANAHNEAHKKIHKNIKNAKVGFSNYFVFYGAFKETFINKLAAKIVRHFGHREFFNLTMGNLDFLGVQYYGRALVKFPKGFIRDRKYAKESDDLGWEIYPEGLYFVLKKIKKYNLPIYITESGLADAGDSRRSKFIKDHLYWVGKSIQEGIDVRGYFYWSLLDNFEWDKGYWPRFGLVEVNFETMERKIRRSAWEYAEICKNGEV